MASLRWVACYIYQDGEGVTRTLTTALEAKDRDAAMAIAAGSAPGDEFVVSVHPESDAQYLGKVRFDAMKRSGRETVDIEAFVREQEEDDEGAEDVSSRDEDGAASRRRTSIDLMEALSGLLEQHRKNIGKPDDS